MVRGIPGVLKKAGYTMARLTREGTREFSGRKADE